MKLYGYETDESVSILDAIHRNRELVERICVKIDGLATGFYLTGNNHVGGMLDSWIEPLMQSAAQVAASYSVELKGQVEHSESVAFGMLSLALHNASGRGGPA